MKYIGENAIKKLISLIKGDLATKQPTITASGLLKGDGAGTVTAADTQEATLVDVPNGLLKGDGTTISAAVAGTDYMTPTDVNSAITTIISKSGLIDTTIPKGRMRGDIKGIGKVSTIFDLSESGYFGKKVDSTNPAQWACDLDGNGVINNSDVMAFGAYQEGVASILTKTPTFADYYNNWTYHKMDDSTGYWTTDIIINELSNSALKYKLLMAINGHFAEGMFYKIERSTKSITTNGQAETKTVLTIYSKYPPIEDTKCLIYYSEDSNASADTYTIIVDTLVTEAEIEAQLPTAIPDSTITSTWNSVTV